MISALLGFLQTLRHTNFIAFFSKNGHGVIEGKKFRGWREMPNEVNAKTAFWTARVVGGPRGDGFFATWCYSDGTERGPQELIDKVELASRMLDLYAGPNCRCRLGFHWKCSLHNSWRG